MARVLLRADGPITGTGAGRRRSANWDDQSFLDLGILMSIFVCIKNLELGWLRVWHGTEDSDDES